MIAQQNGPILLSLGYQIWTSFTTFLLNYCFPWANNLGSCVFIRIIQLILLYLIRNLWRIDLCIKTLTNVFSNLQIMHHNTCGFTKSTCKLLIATNPQHINIWLSGFQVATCVFTIAITKWINLFQFIK
jgi:hypothetical protein